MKPQTVKAFFGFPSTVGDEINAYLESQNLAPDQIYGLQVVPAPSQTKAVMDAITVFLTHGPSSPEATDRCTVSVIQYADCHGLASRMTEAKNELIEIRHESIVRIGSDYAWFALSRKIG